MLCGEKINTPVLRPKVRTLRSPPPNSEFSHMTTSTLVDSSASNHNMERLIDAELTVLSVVKFLSAKDCLSLQAVSRGFHQLLGKHDEAIFGYLLRRDFAEGRVLFYVAKKRNLSRKKLYRAFLGRWSLPKQIDAEKMRDVPTDFMRDFEAHSLNKVMITWLKPADIPVDNYQGAKLLIPNDDVDNVVFIVRVGAGKDSFCALMEWNSEYDPEKRDLSQLIIDKSWCDDNGVERVTQFHIPQDREANNRWLNRDLTVGQLTEVLRSKHPLTLHAVDTRYCQVASLMDNSPIEDFGFNDDDVSDFISRYGSGLPSLWGLTPKFSPFHRKITERDFGHTLTAYLDEDDEVPPPPLEYLPIRGNVQLNKYRIRWMKDGIEDDVTNDIVLSHLQRGISFGFRGIGKSTVRSPHQICNFLRALMKEKCLEVEPRGIMQFAVVPQQPEWVQADKVLDAITSYASFEDQAGKLRLVCRQFDASALRQIEAKLVKTKVIAFRRGGGEGCECYDSWFKATVRRGWSDTCLTSNDSAIDDVLWLASCRCCFEYCADKDSCKNASKPLTCHGYNPDTKKHETQTIDEASVRQKLTDKEGWVRLAEESPGECWRRERALYYVKPSNVVRCSFKEDEMTLFQLSELAFKVIDYNTGGEYGYEEMGRRALLNWNLKRDYGVSKSITSRQFVRSIFLIFARAAVNEKALDKDESAMKKARIAPSQKVTIGTAESTVEVKKGHYSRMKKIMRFYSANNEPMEICFESRSSDRY